MTWPEALYHSVNTVCAFLLVVFIVWCFFGGSE